VRLKTNAPPYDHHAACPHQLQLEGCQCDMLNTSEGQGSRAVTFFTFLGVGFDKRLYKTGFCEILGLLIKT
jgi:hypothetical protein